MLTVRMNKNGSDDTRRLPVPTMIESDMTEDF